MRIDYNVTGAKRKELAQVISRVTGAKAEYQYMPTCAYVIDFFTLSKDGVLEFDDRSDTEIVEKVLEGIADAGFECETQEEPEADEVSEPETADVVDEDDTTEAEANEAAEDTETEGQKETDETAEQPTESEDSAQEDTSEETETAEADNAGDESETPGLTISVPLESVAVGNLIRLLEAKGSLIRKALGIDSLPIEIGEDAVSFPWFSELPDADAVAAYTHLISALCKMSKEQKRVTATEREVTNEKYAFRCFLLRLGFIGEQYKQDRKILLKNLTGSSAFRSGARREAAADEA